MLCLFWQYWYIFGGTPIAHSFFHSLNSCSRCCFNSANRFPKPTWYLYGSPDGAETKLAVALYVWDCIICLWEALVPGQVLYSLHRLRL